MNPLDSRLVVARRGLKPGLAASHACSASLRPSIPDGKGAGLCLRPSLAVLVSGRRESVTTRGLNGRSRDPASQARGAMLRLSIPDAGKAVCLLAPRYTSFRSGRRESNPVYIHPMDAYYRYTTARM